MKKTVLITSMASVGLLSSSFAAVTALADNANADKAKAYADSVAIPVSVAEETSWGSSIDIGASLAAGNSDSLFITASYASNRQVQNNKYLTNITYAFGENDGETSTDELLASFAWKRLVDDYNYWGLRADFRHDDLADIDYRVSLTGVVGRFLIKDSITELSVEGGLGYTAEKAGGIDSNFANLYLGESYDRKLNEHTRVYQSFSYFAPLDDFGDYSIVAEVGLETALSSKASFKVYIQDRYEAEPAEGRKSNDVKIITGVSYKF